MSVVRIVASAIDEDHTLCEVITGNYQCCLRIKRNSPIAFCFWDALVIVLRTSSLCPYIRLSFYKKNIFLNNMHGHFHFGPSHPCLKMLPQGPPERLMLKSAKLFSLIGGYFGTSYSQLF